MKRKNHILKTFIRNSALFTYLSKIFVQFSYEEETYFIIPNALPYTQDVICHHCNFCCCMVIYNQVHSDELKNNTLRINIWHRSRFGTLGTAKLLGESSIPLSSLAKSDNMYHWYSLYQVSSTRKNSSVSVFTLKCFFLAW